MLRTKIRRAGAALLLGLGALVVCQPLVAQDTPTGKPDLLALVKAVAKDGKGITLKILKGRNEGKPLALKITAQTKLTYERGARGPQPGQTVEIWLEKGSMDRVVAMRFRPAAEVPGRNPGRDVGQAPVFKDEPNLKPYVAPKRDPAPLARLIDEPIEQHLREERIPASGPGDDAEFLRRVTLDLTGRVPSYQRTVAFLTSTDPNKRRNLIEDLLASRAYGDHFATVWRNRIVGQSEVRRDRSGRDRVAEGLSEDFDKNRPRKELGAEMVAPD